MIFKPELVEQILAGRKTMTRRPVSDNPRSPWYRERCSLVPGRDYAVCPGRGKHAVARIRVTDVRREPWGAITEADAVAEGFGWSRYDTSALAGRTPPSARFLRYVRDLYPNLDLDAEVWVVSFQLVEDSK